jgi:hypothetical protein
MRGTSRKTALRVLSLLAVSLCAAGWVRSYHLPAGLAHVHDNIWIAESSRGSIVIARLHNEFMEAFMWNASPPASGWVAFDDTGWIADEGTIAEAWLGRHPLGFGLGVERDPRPSDPVWFLDQNGVPVATQPSEVAFLVPPRSGGRQFALMIPWWFVWILTLGITLLIWQQTKPKYAAFPISPGGPKIHR